MSESLSQLGGDLCLRLIITLLHLVWQGAAVGVLVAIVARLLRNVSASIRYAIYGLALACLPICVVVTGAIVSVPVIEQQKTTAESLSFAEISSRSAGVQVAPTALRPETPTAESLGIDSLTFTPDGQYLAEGPDSRGDIPIRDMRTLEVIASLKDEVGSPLMVSSINISPNGRFLVAHNEVSVDQNKVTIPHRIHVWDLHSRKPVFQVATGEWVRSVTFSDDGRMIVGEFTGAAHGGLLAAWKLPEEVFQRRVEPQSNARDRLGDAIQWSTWGDDDGLLSGARLILPESGLVAGSPLVVEYRLANVSSEPKTLEYLPNTGMQFASLSSGNRIGGFGMGKSDSPETLMIEPGGVFVDSEHLVSIDTTGLAPGQYQVALGSAFFYPDESRTNVTHAIPHHGSITLTLHGAPTWQLLELPKDHIHWGQAVAGIQFGARWSAGKSAFTIGAKVEADLYVANVTDQRIECAVELPHPGDGWLFNVEDADGSTITLKRPVPFSFFSPPRFVHLNLAPRGVARITGEGIQVSYTRAPADEGSETSLAKPGFQIVGTKSEAQDDWPDRKLQGKLVSQGGSYSVVYGVTAHRPEIPALRLDLTTSNVPFSTIGPNLKNEQVSQMAADDGDQTVAANTAKDAATAWELVPLDKLLETLKERDQQFDHRTLKAELKWRELTSPKGHANWSRYNTIRFGGPDPGIPEGLPDDFEQPHRVEYLWTQRGGEVTVERSADLERPVNEKHGRMEKQRRDHADRWKYLLPCGFGFAGEIKSITSARAVDDGYVITGLLRAESAVIDGRQNSFTVHLDEELIIRKAELKFHVYDIAVVTSGRLTSSDAPATAKRGGFTKYHIGTKGKQLGQRTGTVEHYAFTVLNVSDPLTDRQFDERVRENPLKGADDEPKPPASPDLNAHNSKQENPIAPELLAAANTIRRLNEYPVDETSEELSSAIRLLEQSTDTEAANSLALQLANHQIAEGINNVRFVGFQILASRDRQSTLKFLQSIADRLPENERQRAMELHRAVARRVVSPGADNRPTPKPAPKEPDKTRVAVAIAFGEPIYLDQLEPGKTLAENQDILKRQAHRGRRLLTLISRKATDDYRRREKLEVTAEMKKSLWETVMRAPLPPNDGVFCEEERRLISFVWQHASLKDWVLTKSLYERYGGRVGYGSLGLWLAADGRNQLIKDYQKSGDIRIEDAEIERALWKEATKPNFADVYPKGERLKQLLAHPPHLRQ